MFKGETRHEYMNVGQVEGWIEVQASAVGTGSSLSTMICIRGTRIDKSTTI
jgi:hypothetical protein